MAGQWDSRQAIFYCGTVGPKLRESIEVSGHLRKVLPHLVGRGSEKASQKKWYLNWDVVDSLLVQKKGRVWSRPPPQAGR